MEKSVISTNNAPAAIGPYSQAIKAGNLVFISGQIPIIPATGEILRGDIKLQTKQVLENLKNILDAAGSCIDNVVKTTVFMKDLNDYTGFSCSDEVVADSLGRRFSSSHRLASSTVVKQVGLSKLSPWTSAGFDAPGTSREFTIFAVIDIYKITKKNAERGSGRS